MTVTIINGGTQGLGEAVARNLAASGASGLVLAGRSVDRGSALARELTEGGTPTIFVRADASSPDAPAQVVGVCDDRFGTVHGLVNIAADTSRSSVFSETIDHWDRMFAVNLRTPYFFAQAAARLMIREGVAGSIVSVGSTSGHGGQPRLGAYSISKGALTVMTRSLAYALMNHRIRVNQVNPGWMDTESEHRTQVSEEGAPENWLEMAEASRPYGRLVKPWEVANAIVFLLSPESGLMSGNSIDIDQTVAGAGDPRVPTRGETPSPD